MITWLDMIGRACCGWSFVGGGNEPVLVRAIYSPRGSRDTASAFVEKIISMVGDSFDDMAV